MKHGFVKVGAYTPNVVVADTEYNTKEIIKAIEWAVNQKLKVLVLPELCITGYTCGDLFYQDVLLNGALSSLKKIVNCTKGLDMLTFVGLPFRHQCKLYNVAAAIFNGKLLAIIPKTYLPNYNEFYEKRHFVEALDTTQMIEVFGDVIPFGTKIIFADKEMPNFKVACEICEDVWVMSPPSVSHARAGATIIANLSASNEIVGKASYRTSMISALSSKLMAGYIYASAGIGESTSDTVYGGHKIITESGSVLSQSGLFKNDGIFAEIDLDCIAYDRSKSADQPKDNPEYTIVEFKTNKEKCQLTRCYAKYPFVPRGHELDERSELILNMQAHALAKRIKHTGVKTCVLGISGGLDSTLALLAVVRAYEILGKDPKDIIGVTMPCFGTTKRTKNNAVTLMDILGITSLTVSIKDAVIQHFKDIGQDENTYDITYENCQARERTQVLMDLSNKYNGLVIGTGDLSEQALGWSTYNGDHMSMYSVNCSIPKTLVVHLIRYQASVSSPELKEVLLDIADTAISPELLPPDESGNIQQKTEDKVGPYVLHDFFLYYFIRKGMPPSKIFRIAALTFEDEFSKVEIKKWLVVFLKRFFAQQFKRNCVPDGVKIGTVSLSPRADWRMPADSTAKIWLKELDDYDE